MLRDEFADRRHEINWNLHRRVRRCLERCLERCLVLSDRLLVALRLVVLKNPSNAGFVPTGRKLALLRQGFLLRRRRSARLALGPSSYAVITNTDSGTGPGT